MDPTFKKILVSVGARIAAAYRRYGVALNVALFLFGSVVAIINDKPLAIVPLALAAAKNILWVIRANRDRTCGEE